MNAEKYLEAVEPVAASVVAENAARVDREGKFPEQSMDALRAAGLYGLISDAKVGGLGQGPRAAVRVIERLARECSSTAMVLCMHYCGAAVIEKLGTEPIRRDIAQGKHLSTLAFSEQGSRSQFWAPVSTAKRVAGGTVTLQARKSWITSANHATAYVWSSKPVAAEGASTIWFVPRNTPGIRTDGPFDGLGLRGNDSAAVTAEDARIPEASMLGKDGGGFDVMMGIVLPLFNALNAACSVGLMQSAIARAATHVSGVKYEHSGSTIADLPTVRAYLAKMRVRADMASTLLDDTVSAMESNRADTMLRVLQCKAGCNDAALEVTDLAMRVCGGAAFRREVGIERIFRDARAGAVMAPTSDVLYDFIGKAVCNIPLF